jgi:hypothetical protein
MAAAAFILVGVFRNSFLARPKSKTNEEELHVLEVRLLS